MNKLVILSACSKPIVDSKKETETKTVEVEKKLLKKNVLN